MPLRRIYQVPDGLARLKHAVLTGFASNEEKGSIEEEAETYLEEGRERGREES